MTVSFHVCVFTRNGKNSFECKNLSVVRSILHLTFILRWFLKRVSIANTYKKINKPVPSKHSLK